MTSLHRSWRGRWRVLLIPSLSIRGFFPSPSPFLLGGQTMRKLASLSIHLCAARTPRTHKLAIDHVGVVRSLTDARAPRCQSTARKKGGRMCWGRGAVGEGIEAVHMNLVSHFPAATITANQQKEKSRKMGHCHSRHHHAAYVATTFVEPKRNEDSTREKVTPRSTSHYIFNAPLQTATFAKKYTKKGVSEQVSMKTL